MYLLSSDALFTGAFVSWQGWYPAENLGPFVDETMRGLKHDLA
jgi:hypothetical protein